MSYNDEVRVVLDELERYGLQGSVAERGKHLELLRRDHS
jgi:ABC-type transport system involved in Fe-S cluster assembly fused permease/ATPase subunit